MLSNSYDNGHDKENALDLWSGKPSSKMNEAIAKLSSSQYNEQHPVKERPTENLVWWLVGIIFSIMGFPYRTNELRTKPCYQN